MGESDFRTASRIELVMTARGILDRTVNMITGIRRICELRFAVGDPESSVFIPFRAVESETDLFPIGDVRSRHSPDHLERLDRERDHYLAQVENIVFEACRNIVQEYS